MLNATVQRNNDQINHAAFDIAEDDSRCSICFNDHNKYKCTDYKCPRCKYITCRSCLQDSIIDTIKTNHSVIPICHNCKYPIEASYIHILFSDKKLLNDFIKVTADNLKNSISQIVIQQIDDVALIKKLEFVRASIPNFLIKLYRTLNRYHNITQTHTNQDNAPHNKVLSNAIGVFVATVITKQNIRELNSTEEAFILKELDRILMYCDDIFYDSILIEIVDAISDYVKSNIGYEIHDFIKYLDEAPSELLKRVLNGESLTGSSVIGKIIRNCDQGSCCGVVQERVDEDGNKYNMCCSCLTKFCNKCWRKIHSNKEHTCKEDDIKNVEIIQRTTFVCPHCGFLIEKASGCADMFCTNCKTGFNHHTMKVITRDFHNPHRAEWLQSVGRANTWQNNAQNVTHTGISCALDSQTINKLTSNCIKHMNTMLGYIHAALFDSTVDNISTVFKHKARLVIDHFEIGFREVARQMLRSKIIQHSRAFTKLRTELDKISKNDSINSDEIKSIRNKFEDELDKLKNEMLKSVISDEKCTKMVKEYLTMKMIDPIIDLTVTNMNDLFTHYMHAVDMFESRAILGNVNDETLRYMRFAHKMDLDKVILNAIDRCTNGNTIDKNKLNHILNNELKLFEEKYKTEKIFGYRSIPGTKRVNNHDVYNIYYEGKNMFVKAGNSVIVSRNMQMTELFEGPSFDDSWNDSTDYNLFNNVSKVELNENVEKILFKQESIGDLGTILFPTNTTRQIHIAHDHHNAINVASLIYNEAGVGGTHLNRVCTNGDVLVALEMLKGLVKNVCANSKHYKQYLSMNVNEIYKCFKECGEYYNTNVKRIAQTMGFEGKIPLMPVGCVIEENGVMNKVLPLLDTTSHLRCIKNNHACKLFEFEYAGAKTSIAKTSIAKTSNAKTSNAKTSNAKMSNSKDKNKNKTNVIETKMKNRITRTELLAVHDIEKVDI